MMKHLTPSALFLTSLLMMASGAPALSAINNTCASADGDPDARSMSNAQHSQAAKAWSTQLEDTSRPIAERINARLHRAEHARGLGHYYRARDDFRIARDQANTHQLPVQTAIATLGLGEVALARHRHAQAEPLLARAAEQARVLNNPTLIAATANALGNLALAQGQDRAAARHYRQALSSARQAGDSGLQATARVNLAALAGGSNALPELRRAHAAAVSLPADAESVRLLLRIAHLARETATRSGLELAQQSLEEAGARARAAGLKREAAEALGLEGHVAAARDQPQQARNLWLQALQAAPLDVYDLRYQWEWQLARSFEAAGDQRRALAAYRRSVGHLEKIRQEIPVEYASGRSSFRETLEPLYLGLADLLLREAAKPANAGHQQQLLREARASLEQLKIDELRDYFRDACIQPLRQTIDVVDPRTAVLYPVLFPDRLELLLSAGGRIEQRTLPVRRETIELAAEILALKLRYEQPIDPEARNLYDWLIAPLAPALQQAQIETLVFVPGGALRTVPAAVLRGSQGYLVEDYAIATAPGLQLLQPEALRQGRPKTLIAGVSQPGPVIDELPDWWVSAMVQQHRRALRRGADSPKRGTSVPVQGRGDENAQSASAVTRAARDEKIAALSLPGVAAEIAELSTKTAAEVLHNQDFLLNRFVGEVEQHPYRIVHIASHGLFQGPPEENFIVTYDRKLDMRRLAAALKPRELDRSPIEILVLSACQTAEGDDRTPLGLSGIALQSGARSALGSLWPVGDAATQQLMANFYAVLADGQHSKAEALRQAQQRMIHSGDQAHPSDWAAFILVGNWL